MCVVTERPNILVKWTAIPLRGLSAVYLRR